MKKIITLAFIFNFLISNAQTALNTGDIAFTGVISRGTDQFSFVLLKSVKAGTEINFTDVAWDGSANGGSGEFSATSLALNDKVETWTAPRDLACGTEIIIIFSGLPNGGDQLLAYQGTYVTPAFLAGVSFADDFDSGTNVWVYDSGDPVNTSDLPANLTLGTNALHFEEDNGVYSCTDEYGVADILSDVNNPSNWNLNNTSNGVTLGNCTYSCCDSDTTWNGTSWSNGTPNLTIEAVIDANYDTDTNGSFTTCTLTVLSGNTVTIADGDYIEVDNDVDESGDIIVESQGNFIQNNESGVFALTGDSQVNKTTAPASVWYEYTYWGSPVSGENIETALADTNVNRRFIFNAQNFVDQTYEINNDNGTTTGAGVDDIDDDGNDWQAYSTGAMGAGVGYATTQDATLFIDGKSYTFIGAFNTGTITVPAYRNDTSTADNNWNFLGNPYPSAIDIDAFLTENMYDGSTNVDGLLEGVVYFWSHASPYSATNNGNQGLNFDTDDYAYHNGVAGTVGGDGVTPDGYIPSGQGFFVNYSDDATSNTGNVVFNNAMRSLSLSADNSQFFKESNTKINSNTVDNKLWINLTSDNGVFNQVLTGYVDGATNGYDGSYYDASKIVAPNAYAALYSIIENSDKKFVIQGKATTSLTEAEVIKLGFSTTIDVPTLFTLSIANLEGDFLSSNIIYLKDNALNIIHNLSASEYTFTSEIGEFSERFEIVFNTNTLNIEDALDTNKFSIISLQNDNVQFNTNTNAQIKTITIFDILGRQVYNLKGDKSSETYKLSNLNDELYIVKVKLSNETIITRKIIKNSYIYDD